MSDYHDGDDDDHEHDYDGVTELVPKHHHPDSCINKPRKKVEFIFVNDDCKVVVSQRLPRVSRLPRTRTEISMTSD